MMRKILTKNKTSDLCTRNKAKKYQVKYPKYTCNISKT